MEFLKKPNFWIQFQHIEQLCHYKNAVFLFLRCNQFNNYQKQFSGLYFPAPRKYL